MDCIYRVQKEEPPIEEKYQQGQVEDAHLTDYSLIVETGDVKYFKTMDVVLQVVGLKDVVLTEVPIQELHYYDDWPKAQFAGTGHYAIVQFNVKT